MDRGISQGLVTATFMTVAVFFLCGARLALSNPSSATQGP